MDTGAAALFRFVFVTVLAGLSAVVALAAPPSPQALVTRYCGRGVSILRCHASAVVAVSIVTYAVIFSVLSILQHQALHTHAFDLGVYDQVVWNTAQGRWLELSLAEKTMAPDVMSYLGYHFSPTLVVFVPFYWLHADPRVLLILQSMLFAIGAVPVYWLAHQRLGKLWGVLFVVCYLSYPALTYANLFDFHSAALIEPALSFGVYYLLQRNYRVCFLFLLFAMLSKEEVGFIVAACGAYALLAQKRWRIGAPLLIGGIGWVYLATTVLIPAFAPERSYYYLNHYAHMGDSVNEVALNLISHPLDAISLLADPGRLVFVLSLLVPLAFAPLVGIEVFLLALPSLGYLLLSGLPLQYSPVFHYGAILVPLLFAAAVEGVSRLLGLVSRARIGGCNRSVVPVTIAVFLLASALLSYSFNSRAPFSRGFEPQLYGLSEHARLGSQLINALPPAASVTAQSDLVPHLTRRRHAYLFPDVRESDYVLLDRQGFVFPFTEDRVDYEEAVAELLSRSDYKTIFDGDGYLLLERRGHGAGTTTGSHDGE